MAADYNITAVSPQTSEWGNDYGKFRAFKIKLAEEGDNVLEISRKLDGQGNTMKPEPKVGPIHGTITRTDGQYPDKFKEESPNFSGGQQQGNQGGGQMDPDREKKIVRQHSQDMAISWLASQGEKATPEVLLQWIDWFQEDAMNGGARPEIATASSQPVVQPDSAPTADDDIPF